MTVLVAHQWERTALIPIISYYQTQLSFYRKQQPTKLIVLFPFFRQ